MGSLCEPLTKVLKAYQHQAKQWNNTSDHAVSWSLCQQKPKIQTEI